MGIECGCDVDEQSGRAAVSAGDNDVPHVDAALLTPREGADIRDSEARIQADVDSKRSKDFEEACSKPKPKREQTPRQLPQRQTPGQQSPLRAHESDYNLK